MTNEILLNLRKIQIDKIQAEIKKHKNRPDLAYEKILKIIGVE